MASYHLNRAAEDMKRELTALLRELKDPRVAGKLLTVVRVHLSGDGAVAKIFISALEGFETAKVSVAGLQSATGFLRGELTRRLRLRKAPELRFVADDSIAVGVQILQKMEHLSEEEVPDAD